MKRVFTTLCAVGLAAAFTACSALGGTDSGASEANAPSGGNSASQTIYGQVTDISGQVVTLQLGEMAQRGQRPDGDDSFDPGQAPQDGQNPQGEPPADLPSDSAPSGDSGENTPPQMPDEKNSENLPELSEGQTPPQGNGHGGGFVAGDSTQEFDLSQATINSFMPDDQAQVDISSIQVGDVQELVLDDSNTVTQVTIQPSGGMGGVDGAAHATPEADSGSTESAAGDDASASSQSADDNL